MKASMQYATGQDSLEGKKIAIQGAGHVASYLAKHLQKEGAILYISDIYPEKGRTTCCRSRGGDPCP
jgi:leucine dehydrogenase